MGWHVWAPAASHNKIHFISCLGRHNFHGYLSRKKGMKNYEYKGKHSPPAVCSGKVRDHLVIDWVSYTQKQQQKKELNHLLLSECAVVCRGMGSFHFYVSMKPSAIVKISSSACPRRREVFCESFKLETRASVWRSVLSTCSLNDNSVPIVVREENLWQKGAWMERPMERPRAGGDTISLSPVRKPININVR